MVSSLSATRRPVSVIGDPWHDHGEKQAIWRRIRDRVVGTLGTLPSSSLATGTAITFVLVSALVSLLFDPSIGGSAPWALRGTLASTTHSNAFVAQGNRI